MKKLLLLFCALWMMGTVGAETIENKVFIDAAYSGVTTIKVVQSVLPVSVVKTGGAQTKVECRVDYMDIREKNFSIQARKSGSTLEIYQTLRSVSIRRAQGYIRIEAPADVQVVVVSGVAGDVSLQGLRLEGAEVSSVSGDVSLVGVSADDLSVSTVSGDMTLKGITSNLAVVRTTSGNVSLADCTGNKIDVTTVSGDVLAKGSKTGVDFSLVGASSTSGNVCLFMGPKVRQTSIKSVSGDLRLYLKGDLKSHSYSLSGVSSEIEISGVARASRRLELNTSGNGVQVRANAVSGNIYVGAW